MALFDRSSTLAATLSNSQRGKGCVPYDPNATAPTYGYDPDLYVFPSSSLPTSAGPGALKHVLGVSTSSRIPRRAMLPKTSRTDSDLVIQRCWHRLHRRLLSLHAGTHCTSDHESQVVVFGPRTGCFWYAAQCSNGTNLLNYYCR